MTVHGLGDDLVGGRLLAAGEGLDSDDGGEEERHHGCHESLAGKEGERSETDGHEGSCEREI